MFTTKKTDHKQAVVEAIEAYFEVDAEKFEALDALFELKDENDLGTAIEQFAIEKAKLDQLAAMANAITNLANKKFEEMSKTLADNMDDLEKMVREYCEFDEHKKTLFKENKSKDFAYGTIGFRKGTTACEILEIKDGKVKASDDLLKALDLTVGQIVEQEVKSTLDLLKALPKKKRELYVIVKESVSKTALKKLPDEELAKFNAGKIAKERFYLEPRTVVV